MSSYLTQCLDKWKQGEFSDSDILYFLLQGQAEITNAIATVAQHIRVTEERNAPKWEDMA